MTGAEGAWDSSPVLSRVLNVRRRRLGAARLIGAIWVLALLTLATQIALHLPWPSARPVVAEVSSAPPERVAPRERAAQPAVAATPAPASGPASAVAASSVASAPASDAPRTAPPPAPPPQPAIVPNLEALPPPPNPQLPPFAVNVRETGLWSGPEQAQLFTRVPAGALFRVLERSGGRYRVFYPGDRARRLPGEAWVDIADVSAAPWPRWVRLRSAAVIRAEPKEESAALASLEPSDYVEVVGEAQGDWAHVYFLGDGRRPPAEGWLAAGPARPFPTEEAAEAFALTREVLASQVPSPWLKVPYRSQLDGSPYAGANCGPTAAGMVLEWFGFPVAPPDLRREVLALQPGEDCDDCGVYIQNLAEVIGRRGLRVIGLWDAPPDAFHRWTLDEIRAELQAGHPVIPQVYYRALPGRADAPYYGDHYIVLTGMLGDRFTYNDPIDSDGPGFSRLIEAGQLERAMGRSQEPFAAFAVGR